MLAMMKEHRMAENNVVATAEAITEMSAMYAFYAEKAIDAGDHAAHAYWGRMYHTAAAGKPVIV